MNLKSFPKPFPSHADQQRYKFSDAHRDHVKELITVNALRRFSYYTVSKTTLAEIAEDSSLSIFQLSQHFPYKEELVMETLKLLARNYMQEFRSALQESPDVRTLLENIGQLRIKYYKKYGLVLSDINLYKEPYRKLFAYYQSLQICLFVTRLGSMAIVTPVKKWTSHLYFNTMDNIYKTLAIAPRFSIDGDCLYQRIKEQQEQANQAFAQALI